VPTVATSATRLSSSIVFPQRRGPKAGSPLSRGRADEGVSLNKAGAAYAIFRARACLTLNKQYCFGLGRRARDATTVTEICWDLGC